MNKVAANQFFDSAKRVVDRLGYKFEYEHQRSVLGKSWSETDFLREYAWVILSSGFRESVVRKWFPYISLAFLDFESARSIVKNSSECANLALIAINNAAKMGAIVDTAARVCESGFGAFQRRVTQEQSRFLESLPFIGEVTSQHLLKNLGFNLAKNDRHLQRICTRFQFKEANAFCDCISQATGEPRAVVDIILWRFSVLSSESQAICRSRSLA